MGGTEIILSIIIGLVVWSAILSSIISGASRSKKIEQHLRIQNALLAKIAKSQGVTEEDVESSFTKNSYTL